ncbi:MAG: HypC/HybG/HupF family hydrogenase formation chaperone [Thermoprotei archaeon]|nr:MAG: HypC/HybG/HupF family hydrogenase formation chaperone [Thermoprotei archaeon]
MCLGVPAKIVKLLDKNRAIADFGGIKKEISTILLPEVSTGDYVIVHAGFAISKLSKREANEIIASWKEVLEVLKST